MSLRSLHRFRAVASAALLLLSRAAAAVDAAPTASVPADPAVGAWLGQLTSGVSGSSAFGLEIKPDGKDGLSATVYLEQLHLYGTALGPIQRDGAKYREASFGLEFTVEGDRLAGSQGGAKNTFELHRTTGLPQDPPVPVDLPKGPGPRWQTKLSTPIWARAALHDGVAYVGTGGGVFNAVKVADGSFVWTFPAGRAVHGEALATDNAVYFACDNGFLFKLARADGRELWRYDLGDAQVPRILPATNVYDYDHSGPQPVLADGVIYIGSGDGSFHAVDAAAGTRVWRVQSQGKIRTTAALAGPNVVFTTLAGLVCLVDRATGREIWKQEGKTPVTSSPVVVGDRILSGSRGSVLRALRLDTGAELWRQGYWGSWVESTPVLGGDGLAYIGTSDYRRVTCFDPADGRVVWRTDVFGWPWGRPALTAQHVYVSAGGTEPYMIRHVASITALDRATGRIAWRWPCPQPPGASHWGFAAGIATDGHTLVVGGLDGTLYAFPAE